MFIDIDIDSPKQNGMKDVQFCEENSTGNLKLHTQWLGREELKLFLKRLMLLNRNIGLCTENLGKLPQDQNTILGKFQLWEMQVHVKGENIYCKCR